MRTDGQNQNELEQRYIELYRCMIEKDLASLSDILDSSFVLVHMTGMQQDKQSFIHSIDNGTLNYYAAVHEAARSEAEENQAHFIGESRVTASVFGGWQTHMAAAASNPVCQSEWEMDDWQNRCVYLLDGGFQNGKTKNW